MKNLVVPFNWDGNLRDRLHTADAPNPIVWCNRCKREHRTYTFTQADFDRCMSDAVKALSDSIEDAVIEKFLGLEEL